jgi:hypothetical protein
VNDGATAYPQADCRDERDVVHVTELDVMVLVCVNANVERCKIREKRPQIFE